VTDDYVYVGTELELFALATNWKSYWKGKVQRFIRGDVLEVGAGVGGTTKILHDASQKSWLCLEPDPQLAARLTEIVAAKTFATDPTVRVGYITDLDSEQRFDTILYFDVLEHIEDDHRELRLAADRLRPGGHLVILCPAHEFLFSPFDQAIGHHRRYNKTMYRKLTPAGLCLVKLTYLDSVGMLLSLANRMILRSSAPTQTQILFWDRWVVRCSRVADGMFCGLLGKSILGVWQRDPA
jgi:SAM-dependent methyltransferase